MASQNIDAYDAALDGARRDICARLRAAIDSALPDAEAKVWHGHPVWFLADNPIVGYSAHTGEIRLTFWSGQSFAGAGLIARGKFKAAEARYGAVADIDTALLGAWLTEARAIQWDYKNIVKRKGELIRLS